MTKVQQSEREQACSELRETLKPGTTVYTVLRHVSRSGMSRDIDVYVIEDGEPRRITWTVAKAADLTYNRKAEAIKIGGCGMDMGFAIVYNLSRSLYSHNGHSFACIGKDCPSNDHNNAYSNSRQNQCLVCRKELPEGVCKHCGASGKIGEQCENCEPLDDLGPMVFQPELTRSNGRHDYAVCSLACAGAEWIHSDGGYALKHRWM
jgi:hypothetical protein